MGLFLAASGVIGAPADDVRRVLKEFALSRSGTFQNGVSNQEDPDCGFLTVTGPNTTVVYPNSFFEWDEASKHLSKVLAAPVFSLHIHDGDLWMFLLFNEGEEVSRFNPVPDYWKNLDPDEKAKWRGDAELISRQIPGVSPDGIARYFVKWNPAEAGGRRAYPDDEFEIGDCWQLADFMRKVGLEYPESASDPSVELFLLSTPTYDSLLYPDSTEIEALLSEPRKKPWWKFW